MDLFQILVKEYNDLNNLSLDLFYILVEKINCFEIWIIYLKYLFLKEDFKLRSQIKTFFSKKISKEPNFWKFHILNDFYDYKQKRIWSSEKNIPLQNGLTASNFEYNIKCIEILSCFFCNYNELIPISIDFREVVKNKKLFVIIF